MSIAGPVALRFFDIGGGMIAEALVTDRVCGRPFRSGASSVVTSPFASRSDTPNLLSFEDCVIELTPPQASSLPLIRVSPAFV